MNGKQGKPFPPSHSSFLGKSRRPRFKYTIPFGGKKVIPLKASQARINKRGLARLRFIRNSK
jgi:hypothetical protein